MMTRTPAKRISTLENPINVENSFSRQVRTIMEQVSERISRIQPKHQKVNESLRAIRSQGTRLLGHGSKVSQNSKAKLIALYQTAQRQCENENVMLEQLLTNIQKIRQHRVKHRMSGKLSRGSLMVLLAQHAATLPLYIGTIDEHPPALVGAIPQLFDESIAVGFLVAAFVEDDWILAEVKSQFSSKKYLIRDIDDDAEDVNEGNKCLTISADRVIALPHYRADPRRHAHALFPRGAIVLALYPQTTCFYKGVVETPPVGPNDDYFIAFDDSTFTTGYSPTLPVPQLYVLIHREISSSSTSSIHEPRRIRKNDEFSSDYTDEASD